MAGYMANCLNIEPKKIKIIFFDGDIITTDVNASWREIQNLYPIGEYINVGNDLDDCPMLIKQATYFL